MNEIGFIQNERAGESRQEYYESWSGHKGVQTLYDLEGNPPFREILLKHRGKLQKLHEEVQENIADWNLAKVDKALYEIEDIFDEIEWELI